MKKYLYLLIGFIPLFASAQYPVTDLGNLHYNILSFTKQLEHYTTQINHYRDQIGYYKQQVDYLGKVYEYQELNAATLSNFNTNAMTATLRGLLNTVDSSFDDIGRTYGGKRRNTAHGKKPYKTIKDWEGSVVGRPKEFYESKIYTADSQMEAIQIASEYNEELRKRLVVDRDNLEHALRDVASATGQLQALQAAAKLAANQAVALQKMTILLQLWMNMQIKRYTDQANKEAAQEAAWKKQTEFDPGDYIPQPMQLKIR